ncbi:MAG: Gfo/Idh/MocA family oxidoreductase [Caldilineales bacterium]|nr:Gfo/Idh/MocA family oxidoreductase [Caldilineales bacterium]
MTSSKLNVAIIGCGNIADGYARNLITFPQVHLAGATDIDFARAQALTAKYGGKAYPTLEAVLADPGIDLVIDLAVHHAHYAINKQSLEAGKHVFSEKPMALTYAEAAELVKLAEAKGLRLGSAPYTYMGEAAQTAWKLIRAGRLGTVRVAYAEVNWNRIEVWHPAPEPFYDVGALYDVGVYPLTMLTAMFGPARRVHATSALLLPDRLTKAGRPFHITTPDWMVTVVEFAGGLVARLTTSFYVTNHTRQTGLELHGDEGSLYLQSWHDFDSSIEFAPFGQPYEMVPPVQQPFRGVQWGRSVAEIADALRSDRPHRASGEHAAHVIEILNAAAQAAAAHHPVDLVSTFTPPAPMPWAM